MKKLINLSIVLVMVLGFLPARTAIAEVLPLWEQLPGGDSGVSSQYYNWYVADDFVFSEAETIGGVEFWTSYLSLVNIHVEFYGNTTDGSGNNLPSGAAIYSEIFTNSTGTLEDSSVCSLSHCAYRHTLILSTPVALAAGHYWVSIFGEDSLNWSHDSSTYDGSNKAAYWWDETWNSYASNLAFRLLEPQETCPISVVVANLDDSGTGSLRQALLDVCAGGTITFDATSLSGGTITLTSQLTLDKNLTIDGSTLASKVTIDANDTGRVFLVNSGVTATLESLRIINGKHTAYPYGGGIHNAGTLTLMNSNLESNNAPYGAGIFNFGGTLSVVDSSITSNTASSNGGGIYNANPGVVTVTNTTLSQNTAYSGGGIATENNTTTTVTGSTLAGNQAAGTYGSGGGISNGPGANMTVVNSTMSANSAVQWGGGIYNGGSATQTGTLTLTNSTLSGNSAHVTEGGGIANEGTLNFANTIIANSLSGGDCRAKINYGTIGTNTNNLVEDGSCSEGAVNPKSGDPMLVALADNGGPTQTMALLTGSPAIDAGDDTICAAAPVNGLDQRGVTRPQGSACDIGAFEYEGVQPQTLVVNTIGDAGDRTCDETCTLRDAVLSANSGDTITFAANLSGATITLTSELTLNKDLTIDGSALTNKVSISGNNLFRVFSITPLTTVTMDSLIITNGNHIDTYGNGGGINNQGTLTINNCSLISNTTSIGGGIYNGGTLSITNSSLMQNIATDGGGALSNAGVATLTGCTISENQAPVGAGVDESYGTLTVSDSTFSGNVASSKGGGIFISPGAQANIFGSTFVNNTAGEMGGGGIVNHGTASVVNSTFTENVTGLYDRGSAINNHFGTLTLYNSTLSGNTGFVTLNNENGSMSLANTIIANTTSGWDCSTAYGTLTESINNWVSDGATGGESCGAIYFYDPMLAPLADNGGPTQTMALLPGSPAIDAGSATYCPEFDQRGVTRPQGSACDIGAYELEQTATTGDLKISKVFDPLTSGYNSTFAINYSCDDDPENYGTVYLTAGNFMTIMEIPTGTTCTVSEPNLPTAPTGWTFGDPSYYPESGIVTITANTISSIGISAVPVGAEVTVYNTISRDTGDLKISKVFDPLTSTFSGDFTIHYDCGIGYTGTVDLAAGESETIYDIPTGTICEVTEPTLPPAPAGWTFGEPSFDPENGRVEITGSGSTIVGISMVPLGAEVTVYNTISEDIPELGDLKISKVFDPLTSNFTDTFTIFYDCGGEYWAYISLGAGGQTTIFDIPLGSQCTISETTLPTPPTGWSFGTPTYSPADGKVTIGETVVEVTVTNTISRDLGELKINKTFDLLTSGFTGTFAINYDCDDGTTHDGTVNLTAGTSQTITGIPTGTQCTVTEPSLPTPPTGWSFGIPTYNPADGTVTISKTIAEVTVTNTISQDPEEDLSQLTTARTKCDVYAAGEAPELLKLHYTISIDKKTGAASIKSIAPSTFLYYVTAVLPAEPSTLVITQKNLEGFPAMGASVTLFDENCARLSPQLATVTIADGNVTINFVAGVADRIIYAAVNYTARSLRGQTVHPKMENGTINGYPDIDYFFNAELNGSIFTDAELYLEWKP